MTTQPKVIEHLYGIYWGEIANGYCKPIGEKMAECIIADDDTDLAILKKMVNAEFLNYWMDYTVIDKGPSIHIHYKEGALALVLLHEGEI